MKVKPEEMPFRFYEKSDGYEGLTPQLYENYITEMLKAYQQEGGNISELSKFVELDENEQIKSVKMNELIEDCRVYDNKMISTEVVEGALPKFEENDYGLAGFLGRYTSIDETIKVTNEKGIEEKKLVGISHQAIGKKALENLSQRQELQGDEKRINDSNKVLFAHLATTKFLARSTIVTAAQKVADGAMMQIGCSQGKTTVLAYASYIDMMQGIKVMNTSSNPGLVLDNFGEFIEPYEALGVAQDMCAITRDKNDKDIIILREKLSDDVGLTVQIGEDGKIVLPELSKVEKKENPSQKEQIAYEKNLKKRNELIEKLSSIFGDEIKSMSPEEQIRKITEYLEKEILQERFSSCKTFEDKVEKMLSKTPLVMADTMTLMKYDNRLPNYAENNQPSICMGDEADCEFLDARPYEVTGKTYSEKTDGKRFEKRKIADDRIVAAMKDSMFDGSMDALKKIARDSNIPLEFLVDAYEVRSSFTRDGEDYVIKDGNLTTLNSAKRVLEKDTQGHEQAIYAMRENDGIGEGDRRPAEKEVLDVKYPYQVMGKYSIHSLISGTMEDRGLSKFRGEAESLYNRFSEVRTNLFKVMGFRTPATKDVVNFRTVGPLTREDRGNVISSLENIRTDEAGVLKPSNVFSLKGKSWKEYINDNRGDLDKEWIGSVNSEINRRKKEQPVLVSVPNEAAGKHLGALEVFTDAHKPGDEMKKDGKMFFKIGQAYFMDDAYGRGYNSKFEGDNGHVLITTLPENSRNLEQFLFRVARGGDRGSSSMIISPTDPELIKFLEGMDKKINDGTIDLNQYRSLFDDKDWERITVENPPRGLTDAYFSNIMMGKISIDRLVFDMYPEKSIEIMEKMTAEGNYNRELMQRINDWEIDNKEAGIEDKLVEAMMIVMKKSRVKKIKTFSDEDIDITFDEIQKEAAISVCLSFAKNGRTLSEQDFQALMPKGINERELSSIFGKVQDKIQNETQTILTSQPLEKNEIVEPSQDAIEQSIADYELESSDIILAAQKANEIGRDDVTKVNEGEGR